MGTPPRRILALGDSYTIGEGVAPGERWVNVVAAALRGAGVSVEPVTVIARTGWTTGELAAAIEATAPHGPFHLVTLMIGVNDQYRGRGVDEFRAGFAGLLARARTLAGNDPGHVLVVSIPDWGVTPFARGRDAAAIARAIDAANAAAAREAGSAGATWVDVTAVSRACGADPAMLVADGLHPSAAQHARWAEAILPAARHILDAAAHS